MVTHVRAYPDACQPAHEAQNAGLVVAAPVLGGIAGAVGALGGVGITLAFRAPYGGSAHSGGPAFASFLAFYAVCVVLISAEWSDPTYAYRLLV